LRSTEKEHIEKNGAAGGEEEAYVVNQSEYIYQPLQYPYSERDPYLVARLPGLFSS